MSLRERLIDLARANLNALLDPPERLATARVEELSDQELEAELARRRARRQREAEARERAETAKQAARKRGRRRSSVGGQRIAQLYALLEVPNGSNWPTVKRQFRRLMRQHHPDLHTRDPKHQKTAAKRTASLTAAYQELEQLLGKRDPG